MNVMTSRDKHPANAAPPSLTVRAAAGQLRIIAVWRALGRYAAQAERANVRCSRKYGFEELTLTFGPVSPAALAAIAYRLRAQSWVVAASLHTAGTASAGQAAAHHGPATGGKNT
jgi:hypothetical protein